MANALRKVVFWAIAVACIIALVLLSNGFEASRPRSQLPFSDFLKELDRGQIADVVIRGEQVDGHFSDGRVFSTYVPASQDIVRPLMERGVRVSAAPREEPVNAWSMLLSWAPYILATWLWWYLVARPLRIVANNINAIVQALQGIASRIGEQGPAAPPDSPAS